MDYHLEKMDAFFTTRIDSYEDHMLALSEGEASMYKYLAALIPQVPGLHLLDLGCGTGLELDEIFPRCPDISVTGIDLSETMLERLREKHRDKADQLNLIKASYFDVDLGRECFDMAVSVESLHHFTHRRKLGLYQNLWAALKPGASYVEIDYVSATQEEEDNFFAEYCRLKESQGITDSDFYHFDTPCTAENQVMLMKQAGFESVEILKTERSTAYIRAGKA